jgi:MoaE-MoaD fusion protein
VHQGRRVRHLEYEAFDALALKVFERIAAETAEHWPATTLAIHHRIGRLIVGEASVAIVAATPHRGEAFQACRYAIERVKQIAPIWKHEFLEDGEAWIEGAAADPEDADARRLALARALVVR